jgi:hypothetical protein
VDVTAQGSGPDKVPAWTKTPSEEAVKTEQGAQAATLISSALQTMGWGANPWQGIAGTVMRAKPHKGSDRAYQTLMQLQQREGKLKLMHFRRVKQLGAGDVGLVDLVQLQVRRGSSQGGSSSSSSSSSSSLGSSVWGSAPGIAMSKAQAVIPACLGGT